MLCAGCGMENPADASFCGGCGHRLIRRVVCDSCGRSNPEGQRFCHGCGGALAERPPPHPERLPQKYTPRHLAEKILTSRSALEGERKHVTVLFADVKGSMDLAERLDPEVWHRLLERFFEILSEGVHHFEGTVNQYTGDGIMALFGAPIAHEDHAQRACHAALRLQDALSRYSGEIKRMEGLAFAVRMGINSGEVVVGKIGDDLRMDYTAQGHTVGLAQRIEQLTDPGSIYLSPHTAQLVEGFFELRDLGEFQLKGVRAPRRLYELTGTGTVRTQIERARVRGFSRFLGRDDELMALDAALHQAEEGHGQVVGVVAEAGIGKSRLCVEFVERCRARGGRVHEAHCPAHGRNVPYLPILELLRDIFEIEDRDSDREAREKIAGRLLLRDADFRGSLPLVFEFLGIADVGQPPIAMDPELRQRELHAFVRKLVRSSAVTDTLVVLVDDLHWIDPASDRLVAQIAEAVTGVSVLLLVNFRPEYAANWMRRSYYTQLALTPLGPGASGELIRDLLGDDLSLADLRPRIEERAGGNPFFTEELVRDLAESGHLIGERGSYRSITPIDALETPETVQATLAARIDRLDDGAKHVLQTASGIGQVFSEPLLREVAALSDPDLQDALQTLREAEFVQEDVLYPSIEYSFRHPLTREVAYGSQLQEQRKRTHAAVARALEVLHPGRSDEGAALIAEHWDEAGEGAEAARWHCKAAQWIGVTDLEESSRHWRRVRELVRQVPESKEINTIGIAACRGLLNLSWRSGSPAELDSIFAEGCGFAERSEDSSSRAILFNLYGNVLGISGDLASYYRYASEALDIAEASGEPDLSRGLAADLSVVEWWRGDLHQALHRTDVHLAEPADPRRGDFLDFPPSMQLWWTRACLLCEVGRLSEAQDAIEHAVSIAQDVGSPENVAWGESWRVPIAFRAGDADSAMTSALRASQHVEAVGTPLGLTWMKIFMGMAYLLAGDWESAARSEREALELIDERRAHFGFSAWAHAWLAEAESRRGDHAEALAEATEAISLAREYQARPCEMDAHLVHARVLLEMAGTEAREEIEASLSCVRVLVEETGARCRLPALTELRADLARAAGDDEAFGRLRSEARRLFADTGAIGHTQRLAKPH